MLTSSEQSEDFWTEHQVQAQNLEAMLARQLWAQLSALGLRNSGPDGIIDVADWRHKLPLASGYESWLEHSLRLLQDHGYLRREPEALLAAQPVLEAQFQWTEWDAYQAEVEREHPWQSSYLRLLDTCLRALPQILRGQKAATEILFPNSSMDLVSGIYAGHPVADHFNEVLTRSLLTYVRARLEAEPAARLRLLEIGAGTGATSARLFEALAPYAQQVDEYCYSDISKAFLLYAEENYTERASYLRTQIFNVEVAPDLQGLKPGSYDLVIAANALHATRDIRATLRNAKALLKSGGVLMINELSATGLSAHLTFGLLPGWWLPQDRALRIAGSPALAPMTWRKLLLREGFTSVVQPRQQDNTLGQQILLAQSDGYIRRQRTTYSESMASLQGARVTSPTHAPPALGAQRSLSRSDVQSANGASDAIRDACVTTIVNLVSRITKTPTSNINVLDPWDHYGIDSLLATRVAAELAQTFGECSPTLLFEHRTIGELADHFMRERREMLAAAYELGSQPATRTVSPDSTPSAGSRSRAQISNTRGLRASAHQIATLSAERDVAIVGLAGRYADSENVEAFWKALQAGRSCISDIPTDRWDAWDGAAQIETRWGGFIKDIKRFDPLFFHISPRDAEWMDPQERLFLEESYACIEDGGYSPTQLRQIGKVGVFVGVMNGHYRNGSQYWSIANRISYLLDLSGPSLAVDTACSSSLTAIHLAVESLVAGKCDCAIAGGVNLIVRARHLELLTAIGMLSPGRECRSFGAGADGFVDGEGVGSVLLKSLSRAIEDGDHIYGVIKATAVNHGGKTHGYTVPNPSAQARVIGDALKEGGIDPRTVSYIEAHGTGTSLGDPIEIAGLTKAFREGTSDRQYCSIGSVKSNIGHCESAAGIAGLTKILLQLEHKQLVPSLHSQALNPHIDFASSPFVVQRELSEWCRPAIEVDGVHREYPRRAGLSSFGAGGSNAHMIVEEYIPPPRVKEKPSSELPALIVLSAKNEDRLKERARQLLTAIDSRDLGDEDLLDVAYTLQVGREAMEVRLGLLVSSMLELKLKLSEFIGGESRIESLYRGEMKRERDALALFAVDEDLQEAVRKWIARGKFGKLLELWVKGLTFDWAQLYAERHPNRISLPTYPFAKEKYWIPENAGPGAASSGAKENTFTKPPALSAPNKAGIDYDTSRVDATMLVPVWNVVKVDWVDRWPSSSERVVILGGTADLKTRLHSRLPHAHIIDFGTEGLGDAINAHEQIVGKIDHVIWLAPGRLAEVVLNEEMITGQQEGVLQLFRLIKVLLGLGYGDRALGLTAVTVETQPVSPGESIDPTHASVHGLLGSAAKEYGGWRIRVVDVAANDEWDIDELLQLPSDNEGHCWGYRRGRWYRQALLLSELRHTNGALYRRGGIYVVIGGAGGLGRAWSEYMIRNYQARIVWIGRRTLDDVGVGNQDRLPAPGPRLQYIQADASDRAALDRAYREIKETYGSINGIVHSALVLKDKSLARMDEATFSAALIAKVDVSLRLAQVFSTDALDFVLFFSSLQSFGRFAGQSNYAAGCTFVDAFAYELDRQWSCPVKVMNWGYWGSVGVVSSKAYQDRMAHAGIDSIEPDEGMSGLEQLMASPQIQVGMLKAKPDVLRRLSSSVDHINVYTCDVPSVVDKMVAYQAPPLIASQGASEEEHQELEERLCRILLSQLIAAGMVSIQGETSLASVKSHLATEYLSRWLDESLAALANYGYTKGDGKSVSINSNKEISTAWEDWDAFRDKSQRSEHLGAMVNLLESTLRALPDILVGRKRATDVLFPLGSLDLVEPIYKGNPVADYFNEVIAGLVVKFVKSRIDQDPLAKIRIIEFGAGTGGTSACVLQHLRPFRDYIEEYRYTDLSQAFLIHAREKYGKDHPYLQYAIVDISNPTPSHRIREGGYDLAIAANVLHATRDIGISLRNAKATLKTNGVVLLNEISSKSLLTHLTFGLLEGWWLYEDRQLRIPGCPGLTSISWERALRAEGFRSIFFAASDAQVLGQQIIVAESDGAVRVKGAILDRDRAVNSFAVNSFNDNSSDTVEHFHRRESKGGLKHAVRREGDDVETDSGPLLGALKESLVGDISDLFKIRREQIDLDEELSKYGLDSIAFVALSKRINAEYLLAISPTAFYENLTLRDLSQWLLKEHAEALKSYFASKRPADFLEKGRASKELGVGRVDREDPSENASELLNPQRGGVAVGYRGTTRTQSLEQDAIAVIGMSGRFPLSEDVEALWRNLFEEKDCVTEIPNDRWNWQQIYGDPSKEDSKTNIKWGGFIEGIREFDPAFFGISPLDATLMDPQQRLLLIHVWKAIEDAGYAASDLGGSNAALFCAMGRSGYAELLRAAFDRIDAAKVAVLSPVSAPNWISSFLDVHGPSEPIDTACSGSLVAVHRGVQALITGDCDVAIVGGVNAILTPELHVAFSKFGALSVDGRCRSLSKNATGYVRSEGVGIIILKRLKDAEAAKDRVYGVLLSSAENHGGRVQTPMAPNLKAQSDVIVKAYRRAGIDPRSVGYVELHGTGTSLGDPIEVDALKKAFAELDAGKAISGDAWCGIGSVKSNIGHLEPAGGVAAVIKVLMQIRHRILVKSLHSEELNPYIRLEGSPFYVVRKTSDWRPVRDDNGQALPRRAGVSSFGAGGVNAHVILQEYLPPQPDGKSVGTELSCPIIIVLSAKNPERLREKIEQLIDFIDASQLLDSDLLDLAYTLQVGRDAMKVRLGTIVSSISELRFKLRSHLAGDQKVRDLYTSYNFSEVSDGSTNAGTMTQWFRDGQYDKVTEFWVSGSTVDWTLLYHGRSPRRVGLPTYPFAKEQYWIT